MKKIRIGNDFVFNWAIERGGLPEDLSSVLEAKLTASVFGKKQDVPFTVSGNIITIEFTPEICNVIGSYNLLFTYILPDLTLSDDDRKCAVDVDAFQIVAKTAQADDSTEFSMTSDMAIALKGDKGDSAYQVWLEEGNVGTEEDYFAYLRQPAVDAAASVSELEQTVSENESLRIISETDRKDAEDLRLSAEAIRIENETERVSKESVRVENEAERVSKESIRNENEVTRVSNENTRVENEATRVENETLRIAAETLRLDAELLRKSGETGRVNAEGLRVTAESERANAETERVTNINNLFENVNELTELPTFDVSKKQRLVHELGILKWEDYE